ncbi:MAG: hypothetical protein P5700_26245, partial [Arthrospira platensis PCC 7345]|nr:hypothetical protein [Arthrospira platensis PCC 7345]
SHLQSQLDEMTRKIDGFTESSNQQSADFKQQLETIFKSLNNLNNGNNIRNIKPPINVSKIFPQIAILINSESQLKSDLGRLLLYSKNIVLSTLGIIRTLLKIVIQILAGFLRFILFRFRNKNRP